MSSPQSDSARLSADVVSDVAIAGARHAVRATGAVFGALAILWRTTAAVCGIAMVHGTVSDRFGDRLDPLSRRSIEVAAKVPVIAPVVGAYFGLSAFALHIYSSIFPGSIEEPGGHADASGAAVAETSGTGSATVCPRTHWEVLCEYAGILRHYPEAFDNAIFHGEGGGANGPAAADAAAAQRERDEAPRISFALCRSLGSGMRVAVCISGWVAYDDPHPERDWSGAFEAAAVPFGEVCVMRWNVPLQRRLGVAVQCCCTERPDTEHDAVPRSHRADRACARQPASRLPRDDDEWCDVAADATAEDDYVLVNSLNPDVSAEDVVPLYQRAVRDAIVAGQRLGELISERFFGMRPLVLLGFGPGAAAVLSALCTLTLRRLRGIVDEAYLFGAPVHCPSAEVSAATADFWPMARDAVTSRIVHAYHPGDALLERVFPTAPAAGRGPVPVRGVTSVDYSGLPAFLNGARAHAQLRTHLRDALCAADYRP